MNIFNRNPKTTMHSMNLPILPALRRLLPLCLLLLALPAAQGQTAAPPGQMSFQGYLTDQSGNPLGATNAGPKNYTVVFRIWDMATGGTIGSADELHAEQQTVTVNNGYFSILLGQGSPYQSEPSAGNNLAKVFTGSSASLRYVEMMVVGIGTPSANVTLAPRLQLVSSPYAYLAANAANAVSANGLVNTNGNSAAVSVSSVSGYNGYVGIGTAIPSQELEVNGNEQLDGNLYLNNAQTIYAKNTAGTPETFLTPRYVDNATYLNYGTGGFYLRNDIGTNVMWLGNNGYVGVGTTAPAAPLDVLGLFQVASTGTIESPGSKNSYNGMIESSYAGNDRYGIGQLTGGIMALYSSSYNGSSSIQLGQMTSATTFSPQMTITHSGAVGIGTTSPTQTLEVNGSAKVDGTLTVSQLNTSGSLVVSGNLQVNQTLTASQGVFVPSNVIVTQATPQGAYIQWNRTGGVGETDFLNQKGLGSGGFYFDELNTNNGIIQTPMVINGAGYVGIGTTAPNYPVEVSGYNWAYFYGKTAVTQSISGSGYAQFQLGNPDLWSANGQYSDGDFNCYYPIGIYVDNGGIAAQAFMATSDRRIKNIVGCPAGSNALQQVMQLRVTDYFMKDWLANGPRMHRGVIAQEVKKVLPQAVSENTNYIPDIYAPAVSLCSNAHDGTLTINLAKAHQLAVNDWVRVLVDQADVKCQVIATPDDKSFTIRTDKSGSQAFVYGRRVNDFMTVDYNQLFATGLGAIQELSRQAAAANARVERLSKQVEEIAIAKKNIAELERKAAQVDDLSRQVAELKSLVAQLTAPNAPKTAARTAVDAANTVATTTR